MRDVAAIATLRRQVLLLCAVVLTVVGCASPSPSGRQQPSADDHPASAAAALAVEQRWLLSWFHGTPVLIDRPAVGGLRVEVPRSFCFEPGRSDIKPALGAVLDKLAESLRRQHSLRLVELVAPVDADGAHPLAAERAEQIRQHLRKRGVAASSLATPRAADSTQAVRLRIDVARP